MREQYNVLIDLVGLVIVCVILLARPRQRQRGNRRTGQLLWGLMMCCLVIFLVDVPGLLLDGHSGVRLLLWLLDSVYWAVQSIYCWLWLLFVRQWVFPDRAWPPAVGVLCALPMLIELVLVATNPLTGWIFTLDAANVYARGVGYLPNMLPYGLYILAALLLPLWGWHSASSPELRRRNLSLLVYMILPICGFWFDIYIYGVSWVWPLVALSLLMVYINLQQQYLADEALASARLENELSQGRIAIMLSQIQPHFLYNTLTAIAALCDKEPTEAKTAVIQFAQYLRGNLDSLKLTRPITFNKEMDHVRTYLSLEKMRFDDTLSVAYDIKVDYFFIPALTVQPLVENAVKYGIGHKPGGGQVTVSSREEVGCYVVTVADDGIGYDPEQTQEDGRTHIGVDNVRSRLAAMCGGSLTITSSPGHGTLAEIIIPKPLPKP